MYLPFFTDNASKYQSWYSSERLFNKIAKYAKTAGLKVVYAALLLYYAIADKAVPLKDKVVVMGALGYFICPADILPDILGPLGYTDDAGVLVMAVKSIWDNISPATHASARNRLSQWFGKQSVSNLKLL